MSHHRDRKQVALLEFVAVGSNRVDLVRAVAADDEAVRAAAAALARNRHNLAPPSGPFALHAQQRGPQIEDQVVTLAVGQRLVHTYAELHRFPSDARLGNRTLLISRPFHDTNTSSCVGRKKGSGMRLNQPTDRAGTSPHSCSSR